MKSRGSNVVFFLNTSSRRPVDEHVVVKEGEQYSSVFNDTRMIGEEVNISYTVTSAARDHMS